MRGTPVCEELLKLLPLVFYFLIFEPEPRELPTVAIAIAAGFATFENVCYLTENGAANFSFLLIRGISAGGLHIGVFNVVQIHCISVNYRVLIKCYSPLIKEGIKAIYCLT